MYFLFSAFNRGEKGGMYLVCRPWTMHLETGNNQSDMDLMGCYFRILTHYSPTCSLFNHLLCGRTVGYERSSCIDIINEVPFFQGHYNSCMSSRIIHRSGFSNTYFSLYASVLVVVYLHLQQTGVQSGKKAPRQ